MLFGGYLQKKGNNLAITVWRNDDLRKSYGKCLDEMKEIAMSTNILAKIAGKEITEADFEAFLKGVPREQQAYISNPEFRKQCLDQLVSLHLFAKLGEELKLEEMQEFKKVIENAKTDILAQLAMKEILGGITVTEEELTAFYEMNKQEFKKGATINAKHILTDSEEKCNDILAAIGKGEKTFEDAAKEFSTCPSGAKGGDLGTFGKGQMVKEFEEAAFAAEIGQVTGPVKTQFGYHLIKVEKKNEETIATFEEVRETIRRNLLQQKQNAVYTAKVSELRGKYVEE